MSNIKTVEKDITPEWAGEVLDRHFERITSGKFLQRQVAPSFINRYAADMSSGAWKLSPDPITFDEDDNLINGQHRLEAVRKSGKTVRMMVSTGWPVENNGDVQLIDVMDGGKPRTIDQMLHLHGQGCARNYTTTVRFVCRVAHVTGRAPAVTYSSVTSMLEKLDIRTAIDRIMSVSTDHRDFLGRHIGPLVYYYTAHPKKAMAFADGLFNFTSPKGGAVSVYLSWLKSHPRTTTDVGLRAICASLRAFHTDAEITSIRPHAEAVEWLAALSPKLREQIRKLVPYR